MHVGPRIPVGTQLQKAESLPNFCWDPTRRLPHLRQLGAATMVVLVGASRAPDLGFGRKFSSQKKRHRNILSVNTVYTVAGQVGLEATKCGRALLPDHAVVAAPALPQLRGTGESAHLVAPGVGGIVTLLPLSNFYGDSIRKCTGSLVHCRCTHE
jgi:hypothetical protein